MLRTVTVAPAKPKTETTDDGITNERIASPEGETIESDVIRFDTALVTVPVTVLDRYGLATALAAAALCFGIRMVGVRFDLNAPGPPGDVGDDEEDLPV